MTFDLSWLWELLNTIVSTMQSWFTSLWTVAQDITNTGQGLFAGLVAIGSLLWDAFLKGVDAFGEWLFNAFKWIYDGILYWADVFGSLVAQGLQAVAGGIAWIATQLYSFGNWVYNSLLFVWNWIVNTLTGLWQGLIDWFSGVSTAISSWWASVIGGINTWFTNLLKTFRQKIVTTIMADITIAGAWKGAERILAPQKMSDIGYGLVGVIASPIIGRLVGEIVNAVVPLPSSTTYPLIPDIGAFTYTPPSLVVTTPTEPTPPEIYPPTLPPIPPVTPYTPVYQLEPKIKLTYDHKWIAGQSLIAEITTTYETVVT